MARQGLGCGCGGEAGREPVRHAGRVGGAQAQVVGGGELQSGQGVGGARHGREGVRPGGDGAGLDLEVVGVGAAAGLGDQPLQRDVPAADVEGDGQGHDGSRRDLHRGGGVGRGGGVAHLVEGDHAQRVGGAGEQAGQGVGSAVDLRLLEVGRGAINTPADTVGDGQTAGGGAGPGQLQ